MRDRLWMGVSGQGVSSHFAVGLSGSDRPDLSLNGCSCFRKDWDALRRISRRREGFSSPKKDARPLGKVAELSMKNHGAAGRRSLPFLMTADALERHSKIGSRVRERLRESLYEGLQGVSSHFAVGLSGSDRPDLSLNGCSCFRKDWDALRRIPRRKREGLLPRRWMPGHSEK